MKVFFEKLPVENAGIVFESENTEEKRMLRLIWEGRAKPVCLAKVGHHIEGNLQLTIAPTPE